MQLIFDHLEQNQTHVFRFNAYEAIICQSTFLLPTL